jgi:hypothetical protein
MTTPSSSSPVPAAAAGAFVAGQLADDETEVPAGGEAVGASDAEADRARAGEEVPADATRDPDGTAVGEADAEADARRIGREFA